MFCKTILGLKVALYSGKYDDLILILLFIYLFKKNKGTSCYITFWDILSLSSPIIEA